MKESEIRGSERALALVPREPRFAVRLPLRMSREGTAPVQIALPTALHDRLRVEVSGSLNHALIALARQALAWLDADRATLKVRLAHDPFNRKSAQDRRPSADAEMDRRLDWAYPHSMFQEVPREGTVVAALDGRPPRLNVVYVQIGLPTDLQLRLREQGVGSVSQLLVYLARYALMRLEASGFSLHVNEEVPEATGNHTARSNLLGPLYRLSSSTVGELIRLLNGYPVNTEVVLSASDGSAHAGRIAVTEDRSPGGGLNAVVLFEDLGGEPPTSV